MRRAWFVAAAAVFVLGLVAVRWDRRTGFTSLVRFAGASALPRIPALAGVPVATVPGGYDGQFYAQLAVSPDARDPAVRAALDNPPYRARRILLVWTAHLLGGGNPSLTLEIYALQNVAIWLGLGWLMWREVAPLPDARASALWAACMLSLGSLDSVRMSLTDLAPVLFLVLAVAAARKSRAHLAALAVALAGLAHESSLAGGALLTDMTAPLAGLARWALAAAPVAAWAAWLHFNVPGSGAVFHGNFDWPGAAFFRNAAICLRQIASGNFDSRWIFGFLGGLSLAYQSLFLLLRPRWPDPWWRMGLGFAALFWVLGDEVWNGYWAVARVVLPMTFAFNVLATRDRRFWLRIAAANVTLVLHGLWRLLP